jgi:calmodulin
MPDDTNQDNINDLREIFNLVDLDGGGTISKDELNTLMFTIGIKLSDSEITNMIYEVGGGYTEDIDFDCKFIFLI